MVGADFGVGIYMLDVCALSGIVLGTDALLFVCLLDLLEGVSASFSSILHEESLSLRLMRLLACRTLFRSFILDYPRKIGDRLAAFCVRTVEPCVFVYRTVEPWVFVYRTVEPWFVLFLRLYLPSSLPSVGQKPCCSWCEASFWSLRACLSVSLLCLKKLNKLMKQLRTPLSKK